MLEGRPPSGTVITVITVTHASTCSRQVTTSYPVPLERVAAVWRNGNRRRWRW